MRTNEGVLYLRVFAPVSATEAFVISNMGDRFMAFGDVKVMGALSLRSATEEPYGSYFCKKCIDGTLEIMKTTLHAENDRKRRKAI